VLRALKDAEFVFEQSLYPVAEYLFKHPLTHEVALNSQLQDRRKRLHARVAHVLESTRGDELDSQAALLAHHWENAGESWLAALWHRRAAEWAGLRNAAEGMRHWQRTRSSLLPLSQTNETMKIGVAACQGMLGLGWRLGIPTADATKIFEDGRDLAEKVGDVGALAALHGTYACVLGLVSGEADEYVRNSREAVRLADKTEDQGLQLAQRAFLGFASVFAGQMEDGIERCEATCRRFPADPALGAEYTGYSPFIGVLNAHAWMLVRAESAGPGDLRSAKTLHQHSPEGSHDFESVVVVLALAIMTFNVLFRFIMVVTSMIAFELIVASRASPFDRHRSRQHALPIDVPFDLY
jgi:hypothetical protein